jgi:hypothetical protein
VAGDDPHEAVARFKAILQRAISCVTKGVLTLSHGGYWPADHVHLITLNEGEPVLLRVVSPAPSRLFLTVTMHYRIMPAEGQRGPWKVSTAAYFYALEDGDGREIVAYHWHPEGNSPVVTPHLHLGAGAQVGRPEFDDRDMHLPTDRVSIEQVIRLAIEGFKVRPRRQDWRDILDKGQADFEQWQTWPRSYSEVGE